MKSVHPVRRGAVATMIAAGLVSLAVAMGIGRFAFTPILPMMQDDYGLTVGEGSWLAVANYVGYLVGALSAIATRMRSASAIRAALVTISLVTLAMSVASSFALWFVLRALAGAASAWVLVFTSSWALEQLGAARRPALGGVIYGGVGVGISVAGLACLILMANAAHAADGWLALGALAAIATAAIWRVIGRGSSAATASTPPESTNACHGRLVLCYGLFGFGYILPATFLPAMAKATIPDPLAFGWTWPMFGVAAALSTVGIGGLARRVGFRALWTGATLVMAAGVALPLLFRDLTGLLAAAMSVGGTFMVITMAGLQEAGRIAGAHAKRLMAAMTSAFAVGQIAGPVLVALLAGVPRAIDIALGSACALLVVSAALLATAPPRVTVRAETRPER